MIITVVTYRKGTNAAHVQEESQTKQLFVMIEDKNGLSQFPVKYRDGQIAYDYPELVPQYARRLVNKAFIAKDLLDFARKNLGWHSYARDVEKVALDLQEAGVLLVYLAGKQFMATAG